MNVLDAPRIPEVQPYPNLSENEMGGRAISQPGKGQNQSARIEETSSFNGKKNDNNGVDRATPSQLSLDDLQKQIGEANDLLKKATSVHLSFFVDEESGKRGVRVIDTETQKVIKQIPPEELLHLAARLKEQIGALLDEKV